MIALIAAMLRTPEAQGDPYAWVATFLAASPPNHPPPASARAICCRGIHAGTHAQK